MWGGYIMADCEPMYLRVLCCWSNKMISMLRHLPHEQEKNKQSWLAMPPLAFFLSVKFTYRRQLRRKNKRISSFEQGTLYIHGPNVGTLWGLVPKVWDYFAGHAGCLCEDPWELLGPPKPPHLPWTTIRTGIRIQVMKMDNMSGNCPSRLDDFIFKCYSKQTPLSSMNSVQWRSSCYRWSVPILFSAVGSPDTFSISAKKKVLYLNRDANRSHLENNDNKKARKKPNKPAREKNPRREEKRVCFPNIHCSEYLCSLVDAVKAREEIVGFVQKQPGFSIFMQTDPLSVRVWESKVVSLGARGCWKHEVR